MSEWRPGCGFTKPDCMLCNGRGGWRDGSGWNVCPCTERWDPPKSYANAVAHIKTPPKTCQMCGGRGGARVNGKWCKCECTKTTAAERKLMRQMNAPHGSQPWRQGSLF